MRPIDDSRDALPADRAAATIDPRGDVELLLGALGARRDGWTSSEAAALLVRVGPNELRRRGQRRAPRRPPALRSSV